MLKASCGCGACLLFLLAYIVVVGLINALLATVITWLLDSFTPWHPTWIVVFAVLCIVGLVFGVKARINFS